MWYLYLSEPPKFRPEHFTNDYGFITDYLAEFLRELRKEQHGDALDQYFHLGKNLNQRDTIAVRRMVGGFVKLLYPDGEYTKEQLEEILIIALEIRRRVKEQLKKLGGMEFYDVNFSYIDNDTFEERFVSVPEQGGGKLIPDGICNPGNVYTVARGKSGMIGVFRLESQMLPGSGKFDRTGLGSDTECKEATNTAFNYLKANSNRISGMISTTTRDYIIGYQDLQRPADYDMIVANDKEFAKSEALQKIKWVTNLLDKYGTADLGSMDPAQVFDDLTGVMKANHISMPSSLTMLARGLATIEGLVVRLNPDLNVMNVVTSRIGGNLLRNIDWRTELAQDARALYDSAHKSLEIPALMADVMRTGLKGEANLGIEHHIGTDMAQFVREIARKLCMAIICAALLVCGGIIHSAEPLVGGISWYSLICFLLSAALSAWEFWWKGRNQE